MHRRWSPSAASSISASPSRFRQQPSVRRLVEAIPEEAWTPIDYWLPGGADVAETTYTPFQDAPESKPVRLIVRRVRPTPGSQLALFATYSYHGFITDREGEGLWLEADHPPPRRGRERDPRPQVWRRPQSPALRPLRRQRRLAGRPGDRPQPRSLDGAPRPSARALSPRARCGGGCSLYPGGSRALLAASPCICPSAGRGPAPSATPSPACGRSHSRPDASSLRARSTPTARQPAPGRLSRRHAWQRAPLAAVGAPIPPLFALFRCRPSLPLATRPPLRVKRPPQPCLSVDSGLARTLDTGNRNSLRMLARCWDTG